MKRIATLFLITIILTQCCMKMAIVAYYKINKDYIVSNFCENKAKPKMQCNGKCYLAKKIKSQETQEQKIPSLLKGIEEIVLFCALYKFTFLQIQYIETVISNGAYLMKYYKSPFASIFQPPQYFIRM